MAINAVNGGVVRSQLEPKVQAQPIQRPRENDGDEGRESDAQKIQEAAKQVRGSQTGEHLNTIA